MRTRALSSVALALCFFSVGPCSLCADTIYSTYGPDPYTPFPGSTHAIMWDYNSIVGAYGRGIAYPFAFSGPPRSVDSITVAIGYALFENRANLQLAIYPDALGTPGDFPITAVEPNPTRTLLDVPMSIQYDFPHPAILETNQTYWLVIQPATLNAGGEEDNAAYFVSCSSVFPYSTRLAREYRPNGWGEWLPISDRYPAPVFKLDGTVVPEPSTYALFITGFISLLFFRRRRS